jgi:hypothetical protein
VIAHGITPTEQATVLLNGDVEYRPSRWAVEVGK